MINDLDIVQWDYLLSPEFEMINSAGKPLTGGYIEVYIHGTRNKYYCASDFNGTLHPFQIPLDSLGSNIVLASPDNAYDVYVYNKYGSLIMSRYNVHCQGTGGGGGGSYSGDKLFYGQYTAHNVAETASLSKTKGNINLDSDGYLQLKQGMSYHITVRGAFQVNDVTNTETTLNYIEYSTISPIKVDVDFTKADPQNFELSYDIYDLAADMAYQVAFEQINGMVTDLVVEVHSLSNLATTAKFDYEAGDYISIVDNTISVTGINPEDYSTHSETYESIVTAIQLVTGIVPDDAATHGEVYEATVTAINFVTGIIPDAQVQSDWDQTDDTDPSYIQNKPDLDIYATHDEVNNVSSILHEEINNIVTSIDLSDYTTHNEVNESITTAINFVTGAMPTPEPELPLVAGDGITITEFEDRVEIAANVTSIDGYATLNDVAESAVTSIQLVTGMIPDVSDFTTNSGVHESIVTAIEYVTGIIPDAQVQSNWTETDNTDPSYIQNKPNEYNVVAGDNIGIMIDNNDLVISASGVDLSDYTTFEDVVAMVSGVTGLTEYGQFYASNITGAATMSRTKGTIDVTNDGKIKLKKGSSYHVTVRGRYNQTTAANTYGDISYIEYITGQSIHVNVDKTITEAQYFELSYDLYKLSADRDYYVFFSMNGGTVNDLFIEIHSLDGIGGSGTGPVTGGTEYDAGWGIQILNNVISVNPSIIPVVTGFATKEELQDGLEVVTGLIPTNYATPNEVFESSVTAIQMVTGIIPDAQVQSDWTETDNTDPSYIQNKPNTTNLVAGDNINIIESSNDLVISCTAIPVVTGFATDEELQDAIELVTGLIPEAQVQSDWAQNDNTQVDYIKNKPNEYTVVAGQNIGITIDNNDLVISASSTDLTGYVTDEQLQDAVEFVTGIIPDASTFATHAEVNNVSGAIVNEIPDVSDFVTEAQVTALLPEEEEVEFLAVEAGSGINIVQSATGIIISCSVTGGGGGGSSYTAGDGIDITNDVISVDDTVALKTDIPVVTGFATKVELQDGIELVTGMIPEEEEVEFEEIDLSNYALASAVPTVQLNGSDQVTAINNYPLAGGGASYTAGDNIDITNDVISVTGTEDLTLMNLTAGEGISITTDVSGNVEIAWHTTAGITDIQMVTTLPANPVSSILYIIPEA